MEDITAKMSTIVSCDDEYKSLFYPHIAEDTKDGPNGAMTLRPFTHTLKGETKIKIDYFCI